MWLTAAAVRDLLRLTALPSGAYIDAHYSDTLDADSGWSAEALLHRDLTGVWHVVAAADEEIVAGQVDAEALVVMLIGRAS